MPKLIDLTGQRFGKLTVIERVENQGIHSCWKCRCDCGNELIAIGTNLRRGKSQSCGCSRKGINLKHGMYLAHIYYIWQSIKSRCLNPNNPAYKNYGGRGISIYPAWIDNFQAFYDYVSQLDHFGEDGYTLDRIDNNGNYEPNNLRWADRKVQSRNRRSNIVVKYQGEKISLIEASEKSGISYNTLKNRFHKGDRGEKLFRPVRKFKAQDPIF